MTRDLDPVSLRWRRWLLALCAVALASLVANGLSLFIFHSNTIAAAPTSSAWVERIVHAPIQSALQPGDLVNTTLLTPGERYRWFNGPVAGERMMLTVVRKGRTLIVPFTPARYTYFGFSLTSWGSWPSWLPWAFLLWALFFATLITWRRADSAEARVLALVLILWVLADELSTRSPWLALDVSANALAIIAIYGAAALFATFAMLFARPAGGVRRALMWLTYVIAAFAVAVSIVGLLAPLTMTIDPNAPFFSNVATRVAVFALPLLLPFLCAVVAVAVARGSERARVAWATATVGLAVLGFALLNLVQIAYPSTNRSALDLFGDCTGFIVPIGLTYSLLNRRLLDIGFALNRAAIFAGVSIVVVGVFVLLEWLAGEWLRGASGSTNLAVSATVVLALGFSLRAIHGKVELVVDRVMFRKRYEDEQALRGFAQEAAYFTDATALLQATRETLEARADASSVAFEVHDGDGHYGSIAENDPAFVALRTWHKPLDLHTVRTGLVGEFAYPMVARGRLVGALVVGPKRLGDAYAPDESDAIAHIAHGVANALDVLSLKNDGKLDELLESVRRIGKGIEYLMRGSSDREGL